MVFGCCLLKKQAHLAAFEEQYQKSQFNTIIPHAVTKLHPLYAITLWVLVGMVVSLRFRCLFYSKILCSKSFRCYQFIQGRSIHTEFYSDFNCTPCKWTVELSPKINRVTHKLTGHRTWSIKKSTICVTNTSFEEMWFIPNVLSLIPN